jgi:hypothetical protein
LLCSHQTWQSLSILQNLKIPIKHDTRSEGAVIYGACNIYD